VSEEFEVLAEWVVRKLKLPEAIPAEKREEIIKRWVLYSLGLDKLAQDVYLYIEQKGSATSTEVAKRFNISPNTARKYLDDLHTLGLVDYIGREYRLEFTTLSKAIELALIPRIEDTLKTIARVAKMVEEEVLYPTIAEVRGSKGTSYIAFYSTMRITNELLREWYRAGKRISIKSLGPLEFAPDVDPELAEKVIERVKAIGPLKIPSRVYVAISDRIKALGPITFLYSEGDRHR